MKAAYRTIGDLTSPEVVARVKDTSILCLPLGAIEQHGPHLPLNTDQIVAQLIGDRIVERWGEAFDLWLLPVIPIGLSREHDWAPGTLSLSVAGFGALLTDIARSLLRALPARNLVIVNGHGGNRGMLEALTLELGSDLGLNSCVIHPFDLMKVSPASPHPDVHGGCNETSVMLALAPELVRTERLPPGPGEDEAAAIRQLVTDRGVSWPWRTDDQRISRDGVIGDARAATAERGRAIVASIVDEAGAVFQRLLRAPRRQVGSPSGSRSG
jgi:creatinine amidohydrolase